MKRLPQLFAGRFRVVALILVAYLTFNTLLRLGLLAFNGDRALLAPAHFLPIVGIGLVFDLAAACWWLPPFALIAAFWPDGPRAQRALRAALGVSSGLTFAVWAFVGAAEFVFWNEFASRFNFIAVDYLIYTREVIGNIRESYDLRPLFAGIGAITLLILALSWQRIKRAAEPTGMPWRGRLGRLAVFLLLPAVSFFGVDARYKDYSDHAQATQLAGNGHYEFWHAFRTNEIDYAQFYKTESTELIYKILRSEFEHIGPQHFTAKSRLAVERDIVGRGPEKRLNVVLMTVESLSAEFLGAFGNRSKLTPRLDRLADEGLLFTRIYATGTRTVRGLEAVTLSIPPTPGNSIVKRPNNDRLYTLGEVFAEHGYEPLYIYGGYGYFDNMNAFFGGNGYTVIDRTAIPKEAIHMENIWGVADEDLYTLALGELDRRAAAGRPFFAHLMTTSNHRPFTYPEGRVDVPSGSGRAGAVKYTDWAIGDFIDRARAKPWFDNTVFVILADHTASGRGKTGLPVEQFRIPLIIYSPANIGPARIDTLASQIDVAPTLLALLNFSYRSHFFGHDIIAEGPRHRRAFLANYQTVGYLEDDILLELRPQRRWRLVDPASGAELPPSERGKQLLEEAVGYYEGASEAYRSGTLRRP
ncbi:MAG: sulfatase-like hydrolase/transferase [Rhodocyclales bacterium]|nr:sulfatase-like hydrolase/transferase [Rhodocyclales bacterium]